MRNVLRAAEYHGRLCRRKYFVNEINKMKRLESAKKYVNGVLESCYIY